MQAPGRALRTRMNGPGNAMRRAAGKSFSADLFPGKSCSSLLTKMSPVHASPVETIPPVPRRRRLLEATLVAIGPSLQRSSAIMCEDNSRFHSNCGWVDHPSEERARVLLGCTVDRALRESRANFENIVRVVARPPRRVGGRVGLSVGNLRLFRGQIPASR